VAGLHRTYISSIERGERNVGIDNVERLAGAFGVSIGELFG
jgi:transcriptional regulator with XRE-family HTH domain